MSAPEIQPIVIGTAGHIDHGKSTLVQRLTGVDPDRWREEKERGMTIDLGFAPLELGDGRLVGIVDVPGHERFIKNMVAGASGIDVVVLVVAADDGVMPQTREHLDIMGLLGIERGFVALTKIDAVDPELAELAALDVRDAVAGTFLADAPILPVSSITGEGFDELRATLEAQAGECEPRSAEGLFRMPVQRVFSKEGFGTVVTGIPMSGSLEKGAVVEIQPGELRGKVRGLHAYGRPTDRARAGHSTAINLSDVDRRAVERGSVVATPGYFKTVDMFGVRLTCLPTLERGIENRTVVRVHVGTAEVLAELVVLDQEVVEPGGTALCQLRLKTPVVAAPGDRFVCRLASPLVTLGGGTILEESRYRLKRFKGFVLDELARQETSLSEPLERCAAILARAEAPQALAAIATAVKAPKDEVAGWLERLEAEGRIVRFGADRWMESSALEQALRRIGDALADWFRVAPHRAICDALELRRRLVLEPALLNLLLAELERRGVVELLPGGRVRSVGREPVLEDALRATRDAIGERLEAARFQPPSPAELAEALDAPLERVHRALESLADSGSAERIGGELWISRAALDEAERAIVANCERNGELAIPELRDALGTTRKFLIPLLEYFDARGLTARQGGNRTLRRG